jgi:hypothetical protein
VRRRPVSGKQADPVKAVSLHPVLTLAGGPYFFALPPIRIIGRFDTDFNTIFCAGENATNEECRVSITGKRPAHAAELLQMVDVIS